MKVSELKQLIREEIQNILKEESNLYVLDGLLKTNTDTEQSGRPQKDILSDIRAIEGITIVSSKDYTLQSDISPIKNPNYYSLITVKIDPDPFKETSKSTMKKSKLQQLIKEEFNNVINEMAAASSFKEKDQFTLSGDMGKFKTGETVTVVSKKAFGNDIELTLSNGTDEDTFYLDRNDDIGELAEDIQEAE